MKPILILEPDANLQHAFASEILKAEGLFMFQRARIEEWDTPKPGDRTVVVALPGDYGRDHSDRLIDYLRKGGRMVAIRPSGHLAGELGVRKHAALTTQKPDPTKAMASIPEAGAKDDGPESVEDGRVRVLPAALLPSCPEPLLCPARTSDSIDCEGDVGARLLDRFGKDCGPAIVRKRVGKGTAVILAYDLVEAVLRLRHGSWDLDEKPEMLPLRGPRHINGLMGVSERHSRQFPLADVHQDVLREILIQLLDWPIVPRVWHLPNAQRAAAFIKSDGCGENGAPLGIELAERYGHKHNFFRAPVSRYEGRLIQEWHQRGHFMSVEFNINPVTFGRKVEELGEEAHCRIRQEIEEQSQRFERETGLELQDIVIHSCQWTGARTARMLEERGWRMPFHFCGHDPRMSRTEFGPFSVASGMPMRYFDAEAGLLDLFLQNCTMDDSQSITGPEVGALALDQFEYAEAMTRWVLESRDRWHVAHIGTFHPCYLIRPKGDPRRTFEAANMFYAAMSALGIELGNLGEWSEFVKARDALSMEVVMQDDRMTIIRLSAQKPIRGLTLLAEMRGLVSQILVNGKEQPLVTLEIEGRRRSSAILSLAAGQEVEVAMVR